MFYDERPVYNFKTRFFSFIGLQCTINHNGFDTDICEEMDFQDTS